MLKQISFKNSYWVIIAGLLLLFLCYELAIKKTVDAWKTYSRLKQQSAPSNNVGLQPSYLSRKNHNLDLILNGYKVDTAGFRNTVLNTVASVAEKNKVKLSEVPLQDPLYHTRQFILQKLSLDGDYFSLLKTFKQLEETRGIGMIRSAALKAPVRNTDNGQSKTLVLEIYLESVN